MVSKIHYNQCSSCGSAAISPVFICKDHTVSRQDFEVWKCGSCTFRFTQDVPLEPEISAYYQSQEYVSHSDTRKGLVNRLYHYVRNFTLKTKRNLLKNVTGLQHGVLLDVGAGTGAFAHTMQRAGWTVTGLEPDTTARENAKKNYDLELDELKNLHRLQNDFFDAITLWHVLEHVHDLHGYLERFFQILKPTGRLVIAVPNYCSYDSEKYRQYWAAYDVPRHLYHFSPKSMEVLLEKKGFLLEAVKPMWFDSFYVSMLSEKYRNGKGNILSAFCTGLVSNIKAINDTKKCSSVIYIIRKK
ncbi:MAG: class SAM-dependent methyltransferase [Segetibacter sp.]|nr:class SAM-dependent methyltransferase [Segetibacter sp.]